MDACALFWLFCAKSAIPRDRRLTNKTAFLLNFRSLMMGRYFSVLLAGDPQSYWLVIFSFIGW
jgi:hypothetical protein